MNALRAPGLAILLAALLAGAAGCAPAEEAPAALSLSEGWIRLPPPGQDRSAAYLTLTATAPVTLVAAESPLAERVEFHTMVRDGDLMRMRELPTVSLEAGEIRRFAPGGDHLMLFGWTPPAPGAVGEITLIDAKGMRYTVTLPLRER